MREIKVEENAAEIIRKIVTTCCLHLNQGENTQIWLHDDIVQQFQKNQEYGSLNTPYVGCKMSALKLENGELMEVTYKREKSMAIRNWNYTWSDMHVINHVYFPNSEEYFFFGATTKEIIVLVT